MQFFIQDQLLHGYLLFKITAGQLKRNVFQIRANPNFLHLF